MRIKYCESKPTFIEPTYQDESIYYENYELGYYSEIISSMNGMSLDKSRRLILEATALFGNTGNIAYGAEIAISYLRAQISEVK